MAGPPEITLTTSHPVALSSLAINLAKFDMACHEVQKLIDDGHQIIMLIGVKLDSGR